jgi:AcrR family transcriptional regulator
MGRHKTYERDDVLEKALILFWQKGFEGTHLKELVSVTGLNRFSLYKEFGSKDGLFEEALTLYMQQLGSLVDHLQEKPLGVGNIRRYFEALIDYKFRHGCFLVNTLSEKNVLRPGTISKVESFIRTGGDFFRENLEASQQRGELTTDTEVEELASFLVVYEIGLLTYAILETRKGERRKTLNILERLLQ